MPSYDAVVVGLGAVGSAAAYHLARQGWRVLGLDRFAPPHAHGSSHGGSRIIRRAYFEGQHYLPLLERAYTLWRTLEAEAGAALLHVAGGLHIGPAQGAVVQGALAAAEAQGLDHALLDAAATRARFPAFAPPEDHAALWEPGAGYLDPEACIAAHLDAARRHGADLRLAEPATAWACDGGGVRVTTAHGAYRAARLVLAAGGWTGALVPELAAHLAVERQVNAWFRPKADVPFFAPARCPVYIWEQNDAAVFYGFPDTGAGVKAGLHHRGALTDHPDALARTVEPADVEAVRTPLVRLLPAAAGPLARAAVCFYTNTPDQHYLVDHHPEHAAVVMASACSGHGFKASNVVGEALAALATGAAPAVDLSAFRWRW
ncbi:MAG: N-methyl-L-tryptophan oxidase [Rhodothermales bacterium]|nr:N-methyl-L-tryptophan oxidase [Rhodothermales bacterium]